MDFQAFIQKFAAIDWPWYVAELRPFAVRTKLRLESENAHFLLYLLDGAPIFAYKEGGAIESYELPIDELDTESLTLANDPEAAIEQELARFHELHGRRCQQLAQVWGEPNYCGRLESPDFPDVDEEILALAIWRRSDYRAELQLRHEDEDMPLLLALSLFPNL